MVTVRFLAVRVLVNLESQLVLIVLGQFPPPTPMENGKGIIETTANLTLLEAPANQSIELIIVERVEANENLIIKLIGNGTVVTRSFAYTKIKAHVIVAEGVTAIGESAFEGSSIHSISLSDSLLLIDQRAFYYCDLLTEVVFGTKLTTIGAEAFFPLFKS